MTTNAAAKFDLIVIATIEIDGDDWTLYSNGLYTDAVPSSQFVDASDYAPDQYSEWSADTETADVDTLLAIMDALDMDDLHSEAHGHIERTEEVSVFDFFRIERLCTVELDGLTWHLFRDDEITAAFDATFDVIAVPTRLTRAVRMYGNQMDISDRYARWWSDSVFADDDQQARIEAIANA